MSAPHRRALVFAPLRHTFDQLCGVVRGHLGTESSPRSSDCVWSDRRLSLQLELVTTVADACERISNRYFNLVLVDARNLPHAGADAQAQRRLLRAFLEIQTHETQRDRRYPFHRIVVLTGDADPEQSHDLTFEMGRAGVGRVVHDRSLSAHTTDAERPAAAADFASRLWQTCTAVLTRKSAGRKAICAAGGGISGIYYELGVVKCLDDAFRRGIEDFDLYYGISAGAIVTSGLANGYSADELLAKLGRFDSSWPYRLQLGWRHLNIGEVPRRLLLTQRELLEYVGRMVRGEDDLSVTSLLGTYAVLLGPLFDNTGLERALRELYERPGRSNDFRELQAELYIGATDQDSREHVLFGDHLWRDVPVSKAVQASSAMHPFFPSVEIRGRYFTDGAVTRTSNLGAAIARGADLIFVLDPFVPMIADEPGFNARHGNMWVVEQDYKTMSHTRFEQARDTLRRLHPEVSVYTFLPSNRMRRLMAGQNPFVSRNFHPIVCEAYRSTYRRLKRLEYKMAGELESHGIRLDLGLVEDTVAVLEGAARPDVRLLLGEEKASRLGLLRVG